MKTILSLSIWMTAFTLNVSADSNSYPTTGGGAADLLNITKFSPEFENRRPQQGVALTCTNSHGHRVEANDPEFQNCVKGAQAQPNPQQHQAVPGANLGTDLRFNK